MNLSLSFFKTAESDLKTAKLLYDNRMYAQAIFYLQQSIRVIRNKIKNRGAKIKWTV